jgi:hypothetical protein
VTHTFLLQPGKWILEGTWQDLDQPAIAVKGKTMISWAKDNWYDMATKLVFPGSDRQDITLIYRGRMGEGDRRFNFILEHSQIKRVEGEGWIGRSSIIQRFWGLNDQQMRTGFETLFQIDANSYNLTHSIVSGSFLVSSLEAILTRTD